MGERVRTAAELAAELLERLGELQEAARAVHRRGVMSAFGCWAASRAREVVAAAVLEAEARRAEISEKRRVAGRKGGRPKKQTESKTEAKPKQSQSFAFGLLSEGPKDGGSPRTPLEGSTGDGRTGAEGRAGECAARAGEEESTKKLTVSNTTAVASDGDTGGGGGGNGGRADYGAVRELVMENLRCVGGVRWELLEGLAAAGVPADVLAETSERVREWNGRFPDTGRRVTPSMFMRMARLESVKLRGRLAEAERQGEELQREKRGENGARGAGRGRERRWKRDAAFRIGEGIIGREER